MRDDGWAPVGAGQGWRRSAFLPVAAGIIAGLALCGLTYMTISLLRPPQPDVMPTVRVICADLTGQRYADLYARLDPALRAQGTEAQFIASQREEDQLQGSVTACAPGSPGVSGGVASLTFTLTRARKTLSAQATLTTDGSSWRITAYGGAF
ncbi:MAG TPA: hypothetical protein VF808_20280 [Ktedonobacterales bacterium]